jgi:hypothetical protein
MGESCVIISWLNECLVTNMMTYKFHMKTCHYELKACPAIAGKYKIELSYS